MGRPAKPWLRKRDNWWHITVGGKKVNLGVRGAQNENLAWAAYHRLKAGEQPKQPNEFVPPPVTVRQIVAAFIEHSTLYVEPPTLLQYRLYLLPFCGTFGDRSAASISEVEVEDYSLSPNPTLLSKKKPKWGAGGRAKFLRTVNRLFRYAERRRLIDRNPLLHIRYPKSAGRSEEVLISQEEFQRLYAAAKPHFRPILHFCWLTGCRPGEAAQLTAKDFDRTTGVVTVRNHKTKKQGKVRKLYPPPEAIEMLRLRAKRYTTGPLFRNQLGNRWEWTAWGYAMRVTAKRAGLKGKILYGFRHSWATDALAKGVPESVTAEALGHSTKTLQQHYNKMSAKTTLLLEAAKKVR